MYSSYEYDLRCIDGFEQTIKLSTRLLNNDVSICENVFGTPVVVASMVRIFTIKTSFSFHYVIRLNVLILLVCVSLI